MRKRVLLLSPYAGNIAKHERYLRRAIRDSVLRNEAPYASHRMYCDALKDRNTVERQWGFECEDAWYRFAQSVVVYEDYGISPGMRETIMKCLALNLPVERRHIGENP